MTSSFMPLMSTSISSPLGSCRKRELSKKYSYCPSHEKTQSISTPIMSNIARKTRLCMAFAGARRTLGSCSLNKSSSINLLSAPSLTAAATYAWVSTTSRQVCDKQSVNSPGGTFVTSTVLLANTNIVMARYSGLSFGSLTWGRVQNV
jgi:hypothetical protein